MPTIEISSAAFEFLKKRAKPLEDTTVTVMDRLIAELEAGTHNAAQANASGLLFNAKDAPSMKHTAVIDAEIDGSPASQNYWNNILEDVISASAKKGASSESIIDTLSANIKFGRHEENGFRYVPDADISFQGLDADRAYKNIVRLAISFNIRLSISVKWPNKADAAKPNAIARVIYP